jgi:hypothetical protein
LLIWAHVKAKKVYVYVDESGQDNLSQYFIVVAVASDKEQALLRDEVETIETSTGTGKKKWHKLRHSHCIDYITAVLQQRVGFGDVYFGRYTKPVPFFSPMITVIEEAIKKTVKRKPYGATVYIDGIDKQKAKEVTNVLRGNGVTLRMVKSRRDESEPLIRLADMWAGCLRNADMKGGESKALVVRAIKDGYLTETTKI